MTTTNNTNNNNNNNTIKIKFFSDFCDSQTCKEKFEYSCNVHELPFYGFDKEVYFTTDDDYTHAIILNKAMPPELKQKNIPKENVIGLACEPFDFLRITPTFVEYAKKHIGKYLIGDKRNLPEPFIGHFGYMWFDRPAAEIQQKNKVMSIVLSDKKFAPGHNYRHSLVNQIIANKLPIDIYGRGSNAYKNAYPNHVKGEFTKSEPYEDYLYTVAIENFTSDHYVSEKILTPVMYNCMPIYIGAKYIQNYVSDVILLSGNCDNDIKLLIAIIENPGKYYKKTYTEKNLKTINLLGKGNLGSPLTPPL
jgi:hypothetical protein